MAFDRKAFEPTPVEVLDQQDKQAEQTGTRQTQKTDVLELKKDGTKNRLRILPAHPNTGKAFMRQKMITFLKQELTDKDGNPIIDETTKKQKIGAKPVFDAIVHGKWDEGIVPKDIIRMYRDIVFAKSKLMDKDAKAKFLVQLQGSPYKKGVKPEFNGIKPQETWMCYGILNGEFGRIELKTTVKDKLNTISREQDEIEGVIKSDIYTGVDTGKMAFITYYEEKDGADKYQVSVDLNGPTPLKDEDGEKLLAQKSLTELYVNCYKLRDFELALNGLKRFDEESGYNVFAIDEFIDEVEIYYNYWESKVTTESEEEPSTTPEPTQNKATTQAPPFKADSPATGDKFDQMDFDQLKKEATALGLKVGKSFTEAILREAIRDELAELETSQSEFAGRAEGLDVAAELAKPIEETPPVQQEKAATPAGASRLDRFKSKS